MHIHFVGIGGSGVSGLCLMAKSMGYTVSGCDRQESSYFKMVKDQGVECKTGHSPDHLKGVDIVVRSSAVPVESEEINEAVKRGIKVVSRGSFLAMLVKGKPVIGIAGSHGKTTTTWLTYHILKMAGISPSVYAGGKSTGISNICDGNPYVLELDESDGSIFEFMPQILVINNLEFEHADFYSNPEQMLEYFERYLLSDKPQKLIIGRGYDLSNSLFSMFSSESFPAVDEIKKQESFENISGFDFFYRDGVCNMICDSIDIEIGLPDEPAHTIQNRASALLASANYLKSIGKKMPDINYREFWKTIPSVDRRFEVVGEYNGISLVDDYAHHPSELRALIEQAELKFRNFGIIFQPHRISRFTTFYNNFFEVLKGVEPLIILPVYSAGEKIEGADSKTFFNEIKKHSDGEVYYFENIESAAEFLKENLGKMHISALVAAGAGDLNNIFKYLGKK